MQSTLTDALILFFAEPPLSSEHCPRLYGLYAHESDCSRFWKCAEGHAFAFHCPEGLAYNEYSAHCDWPDQVENCDSECKFSLTTFDVILKT